MSIREQAPFIVVSGIIGAGKTTLTSQLSDHLGYAAMFEPVQTNPYLEDFYRDMARWTFPMQMFLLAKRFQQHQECLWKGKGVVLDRSIYEDTIFARMHRDDGLMDDRDWETYSNHFHVMQGFLRYPDVILYLRVPPEIAMERIGGRGRDAEKGLEMQYLERLYEGYEEFAEEMRRYTVVVPVDWSEYRPVEEVAALVDAATKSNQKFLRSLRRI
jgi:deoxyadenosine kinase